MLTVQYMDSPDHILYVYTPAHLFAPSFTGTPTRRYMYYSIHKIAAGQGKLLSELHSPSTQRATSLEGGDAQATSTSTIQVSAE